MNVLMSFKNNFLREKNVRQQLLAFLLTIEIIHKSKEY